MDAKSLISLSKAKFAYHSNRIYLKEKYTSKLIIAEQGGMWQITPEFLSFLIGIKNNKIIDMIIMDMNNNPIKVNVTELHDVSFNTYDSVMNEWYNELQEIENQR